jgi:phospholipid transport system substrate-binding protein
MHLAPSTRSLFAAALAGLAILAAVRPASAGPATDRLREFFASINVIINDRALHSEPLEKVARVKRLVTDIADVRGAAAAALEREWDARTPAERDEFVRLFSELLERGLVARLAGAVSPVNGLVMSWRGETRVGDEARVMTIVESRDGRKINVEYRMGERRGRWLVRDVVVDGVSTIENYRSQFKRLLRTGSYATLVAQLRAKLGEETLMFAQAPPSMGLATSSATPPAVATRTPAPRVAARESPPAAKSTAAAVVAAKPTVVAKGVPAPAVMTAVAPTAKPVAPAVKPMTVAKAVAPVAKASAPAPKASAVTKAAPAVVAKVIAPAATKSVVPPPARRAPSVEVVAVSPSVPRAKVIAMAPSVAPDADVLSPVTALDVTAHLLPSVLLVLLGLSAVSGAVYFRRRATAGLVLERLRDADKRLVLVHPVARVAKVGERRRKRRVVPAPRNPARHVDDAHGA